MIALVCASDFNRDFFLSRFRADAYSAVVAVDGGYAHLHALGITPTFAVGDFDSLGYVPEDCEVLTYPPEKDCSDYELALRIAQERFGGNSRVLIVEVYGALGRRLDHTLGALQVSASFCEDRHIIRLLGMQECVLLMGKGCRRVSLPALKSGTISVFALSDVCRGVAISGLKYELPPSTLTNTMSLGLSNEFVGTPARIVFDEGVLCVICPLKVASLAIIIE